MQQRGVSRCERGRNHAVTTGVSHSSHWQTRAHGHRKNEGQENILELMALAVMEMV